MRSSEPATTRERAPGQAPPARSERPRLKGVLVAWACALAGAGLIAYVRPGLARSYHKTKTTRDVYALPAPEHAIVMSLGYRSALADTIYAHVLVSYGLHFEEKRRFEFVGNYLDTINALDPKFRQPYRFADTLLTLQPKAPRRQDYYKAREVLERGMRERPTDYELWSQAGQYMAYLAPPRLEDPKVQHEWRMAGARALARACELIGKNENIPYHCITAASLFSRAGERAAVIQFLERVLAVSDNEEIRNMALGYLEATISEQQRVEVERRYKRFQELWQKDLPFVNKDVLLVLGPPFDPARCAGVTHGQLDCARTWRDWAAATEKAR